MPARPRRPRGRFPFITIIIALLILGGTAVGLYYFSAAEAKIIPVAATVSVEHSFAADPATGSLPYEIVSATKTGTQTIPATGGTREVTANATGQITIYNTQATSQKLIANTRFATPAGLIFRIKSAVTIPAGTNDRPGTVTVPITADSPGPTYNIGPSSFTVPGLAGTPQESAVYARSSGPMEGGMSGSVPVVDPAAEESAVSAIRSALETELAGALDGQVPDGYILLPGAATTTYRTLPTAPADSGKAAIQVEGMISGVVFPADMLSRAIAVETGSAESVGSEVTLGEGSTLALAPSGALPTANSETFAFTLSGAASLVAVIDPIQIATTVAGKSRSEAEVALTNYPEVRRAILILRPFWRQSFPEDPAGIKVVVLPPDEG